MCSNVLEVCCKCFISMLQKYRDVAHVATVFSSVCPKHFICFRPMLQVFHLHVACIYACCKHMFQVFRVFHTYILSVLSEYCICFAMATNMFFLCVQTYVISVSDVCYKCFNCFGRMLQSISSRCCKTRSSVAHVVVGPICRSRLL
jgi:hypothetical protein